jgi:hypothetical protein
LLGLLGLQTLAAAVVAAEEQVRTAALVAQVWSLFAT